MLKWMRSHNKKLLAVFGVLLMIVFILPNSAKNSRTFAEESIGTLNGKPVLVSDVNGAFSEWSMLNRRIAIQQRDPRTGKPQYVPLARTMGPDVGTEMEKNRPMFYLMLREADRLGVRVNESELNSRLQEVSLQLDDRLVSFEDLGETENADIVRSAVRHFMMLEQAFYRESSVVKVTEPLLKNAMARSAQEIKLQLIELNAKDFMDQAGAPQASALQEQFTKYADVLADVAEPKINPAGYGYKYPDRVKLQYIAVPIAEVRAAVRASKKDDYDWEVDAKRYYNANLDRFPTTKPASTQPTTKDAFSLGTVAAAPTTRPFEDVKKDAIDAVIEPLVGTLARSIETRIAATMSSDYNAYRAVAGESPTTIPTTVPTIASANPPVTSLGVAYNNPEYMTRLAGEIQKQFKVVPTVVSLNESFLTEKQLNARPDSVELAARLNLSDTVIQQLGLPDYRSIIGFEPVPLGTYAVRFCKPLANGTLETEDLMAVLQPSRPLIGRDQARLIFRVTAIDPAHRPQNITEVADQVVKDAKSVAAQQLTRDAATKLIDEIRKSDLRSAALAAKKFPVTSGWIQHNIDEPLTDLALSNESRGAFLDQAFELLGDAAKDSSKPVIRVIDLPRDGKLYVAQLADIRLTPGQQPAAVETRLSTQLQQVMTKPLFDRWFDYSALTSRIEFKEQNAKAKKS